MNLKSKLTEYLKWLLLAYVFVGIVLLFSSKLILDLKNTFDGNVKKIGSKLISSKKGMHGLGLESVNAVVDKYHGVMNVSNSDDMFTESSTAPKIKSTKNPTQSIRRIF